MKLKAKKIIEEYLQKELKNALPRVQCLELTPEHMTGKLVLEHLSKSKQSESHERGINCRYNPSCSHHIFFFECLHPKSFLLLWLLTVHMMNYLHRLCVGRGFCYAAERHEPLGCLTHPKEQGMSTMPLSHWVTFGNTFLKILAAPFISAFVIVPS